MALANMYWLSIEIADMDAQRKQELSRLQEWGSLRAAHTHLVNCLDQLVNAGDTGTQVSL